jgi:hypothetical protein
MNQSLTKPIADYMDAGNAFDTAAMLATFKDDVRDGKISQLIILQISNAHERPADWIACSSPQ